MAFIISADLGQMNDYSAISVIEFEAYNDHHNYKLCTRKYNLRHLERPELGTPYPRIVERLAELWSAEELKYHPRTVCIDLTGVGRPVWDLMQRNFQTLMYGITITGGQEVSKPSRFLYNTPKRDLIAALQVSLQNGNLKIAAGLPLADILVKEMQNFRVKINLSGHDSYEAWREKDHDDLVLSVSMAVWLANQPHIYLYSEPRPLFGQISY